jgi:hypothetical protein
MTPMVVALVIAVAIAGCATAQLAYSSASSMIEGTIGLPVYYPAQSTNGSNMQVVEIKPMYHNGSNPVQVQYRNETISLDIPSYEECISTLRLHEQEALTLGVTIHINSTYRAYDECLRQQSTQQAGPLQIEMLYANDLNNVVQKLSMGGMCVFDDNLKALEEELGSEFSQPVKDSLKRATEQSLIQTAAYMDGVPAPVTEQECTVKQTWLRSLDE